jgi:hypothetical protein
VHLPVVSFSRFPGENPKQALFIHTVVILGILSPVLYQLKMLNFDSEATLFERAGTLHNSSSIQWNPINSACHYPFSGG